jgi:hypothetical protein
MYISGCVSSQTNTILHNSAFLVEGDLRCPSVYLQDPNTQHGGSINSVKKVSMNNCFCKKSILQMDTKQRIQKFFNAGILNLKCEKIQKYKYTTQCNKTYKIRNKE